LISYFCRQALVGTTIAVIGPKKAYPANAGLSVEQPMNSSFAGKVVLTTDGTFGIGRGTAVGNEQILDSRIPKSAPTSPFETAIVSSVGKATFNQMLPSFEVFLAALE